jgi:hypothetical protein
MYLHNLTDSREAGQWLQRFWRRRRGRGASATIENIRPTILEADGRFAIRIELPDVELDEVMVHDDVLTIKLTSRGAQASGTGIQDRSD